MITALTPEDAGAICTGCHGQKKAPIAAIVVVAHGDDGVELTLCEECGRDLANAVGFMCIKDGGWSKIVPRKDSLRRTDKKTLKKLRRDAR